MIFQGKPFDDISLEDILALQEQQVPENKTLEYKLKLPGNSDADKREFLADVSSFANAAGGHIVFGVAESEGAPTGLPGLGNVNVDNEILRLESIVRDGLAPRVPGLRVRDIQLPQDTRVLLMQIPRSWVQPHMVTFKGSSRFYSRNSAGKYQLDLAEIRGAFLLSAGLADRLRSFRLERIGNVIAGQTPLAIPETATAVFHSIPFAAFDAESDYLDYSRPEMPRLISKLRKIYGTVSAYHPNFDGIVAYKEMNKSGGYVQIFRTGALEAVDVQLLQKRMVSALLPEAFHIQCPLFEQSLITTAQATLEFQKGLGMEPPVALMVSLVRVSGYSIPFDEQFYGEIDMGHPIDRDTLFLPELIVEDFDVDVPREMRRIFDVLWNAAGHQGSPYYDRGGQRLPGK